MTKTIEIITGASFFTSKPCVGITFQGDNDSVAFTKWASEAGRTGRPSTVRTLGNQTEAQVIARLRADFQDWIQENNLDLAITKKVRRAVGEF